MGIMLHCKTGLVTRDQVFAVPTPPRTKSHCPIPHGKYLASVQAMLVEHGMEITQEQHGLSQDGNKYFGLLGLAHDREDYACTVGVRNSHDKTFPAGIVAGVRVLVCDNLSFSGEIKLSRKHTRHILTDLNPLMGRMIGKLSRFFNQQDNHILAYKQHSLTNDRARFLMVEGVKRGVLGCTHLPKVLEMWEETPHEEFAEFNLWRLFNAVTEVAKGWSAQHLVRRTQLLHNMCDAEITIASAA